VLTADDDSTRLKTIHTRLPEGHDLEQIAKLDSLTALAIPAKKISRAGIAYLARMSHLRFLRLDNPVDATIVTELRELPALERLTLRNPEIDHLNLTGLPRLRRFGTECINRVFGHLSEGSNQSQLTSLRLASLPALESIRVWGVVANDVQFADLPALRDMEFGGSTLPPSTVNQLQRLPSLESLGLDVVTLKGMERLALQGMSRLRQLEMRDTQFSAVRFDNLPELKRLVMNGNPMLAVVEHGELPKLERFELDGSPRTRRVDLRGLLRLKALKIPDTLYPYGYPQLDGAPRPRPRELPGLGDLSQIEELNLKSTLLDTKESAEIERLKNLKTLELSSTWLPSAEVQRLRSLTNLENLDLTDTEINDGGLAVIGTLPRLMSLTLGSTSVSDDAVQRLQQRRQQLSLGRSSRAAESKHAALTDLKRSIALVRAGSPEIRLDTPELLGDGDFQDLASVSEFLVALHLNRTHLTDTGLEPLRQLVRLESLELSQTRISDHGLKQLAGLLKLRKLNLASTLITGAGLGALNRLTNLRTLDLSGTDVSDESLAQLRLFPRLEELSLGNTQVTDAGLIHLQRLSELRVLDLGATHVTDAGMAQLRGLLRLEALRLAGCNIEGQGLDQLEALSRLTTLDLSCTRSVNDRCLANVAKLTRLKSLSLGSGPSDSIDDVSELSDAGLRSLVGLPDLQKLSIPLFVTTPDMAAELPKIKVETPTCEDEKTPVEFQLFAPPP
jgi:Leucine-rich repeat (LRR) protein